MAIREGLDGVGSAEFGRICQQAQQGRFHGGIRKIHALRRACIWIKLNQGLAISDEFKSIFVDHMKPTSLS